MILRKPYAFLIKHFKKINILIFLLTLLVYSKTMDIIGFVKSYSITGVYNELDLISNYINASFILPLIFICGLSIVLVYLLKHKDKPIKTYVFLVIEYLILIGLLIYVNVFFNDVDLNGFNRQQTLLIIDFLTIVSIFQYPILIMLFIRSIGLDLKSFGFSEDKYLLANEEDREEIEIESKFDKDKHKRNFKKIIRETKYFILENKVYLTIIVVFLSLFTGFFVYKNIYLKGKIYSMNSSINSNYYTINVKDAYITNRDYKGDEIDNQHYFVILNTNIRNNVGYSRKMALNRFMLYVGNKYYVPDTSYDESFKDMGEIYHDQSILPGVNNNYFIIFKIDKPKENDNFLLKYQDVIDEGNLIRVKLKIKDIAPYIEKDNKTIMEEMEVPINLNNKTTILFNSFDLRDNIDFNYVRCDKFKNCPVYQENLKAKQDRLIMYLTFNPVNKAKGEVMQFIKNYGKIRYRVGDKVYLEKISEAVNKSYSGNYLYYSLSKKIIDASSIEFVFTVRSYQYIYKLR